MKKILALLFLSSIVFMSCEGDPGPPGPEGPQGPSGGEFLAQTFEIDNVDFVSTNGTDAAVQIPIPNNIDVFEADVPLVYILDPETSAANNADAWEPLPRVFFFADGFAQFRYNFIFDSPTFDIEIILESDDIASLGTDFTDDQIFRIVVVPSEFINSTKIDLSDFNAVQNALDLKF